MVMHSTAASMEPGPANYSLLVSAAPPILSAAQTGGPPHASPHKADWSVVADPLCCVHWGPLREMLEHDHIQQRCLSFGWARLQPPGEGRSASLIRSPWKWQQWSSGASSSQSSIAWRTHWKLTFTVVGRLSAATSTLLATVVPDPPTLWSSARPGAATGQTVSSAPSPAPYAWQLASPPYGPAPPMAVPDAGPSSFTGLSFGPIVV